MIPSKMIIMILVLVFLRGSEAQYRPGRPFQLQRTTLPPIGAPGGPPLFDDRGHRVPLPPGYGEPSNEVSHRPRISPELEMAEAVPYHKEDLEAKLTRTGKWPEFIKKVTEEQSKMQLDEKGIMIGWQENGQKWQQWANDLDKESMPTPPPTTQRSILRIAESAERPSHGMEAYWEDKKDDSRRETGASHGEQGEPSPPQQYQQNPQAEEPTNTKVKFAYERMQYLQSLQDNNQPMPPSPGANLQTPYNQGAPSYGVPPPSSPNDMSTALRQNNQANGYGVAPPPANNMQTWQQNNQANGYGVAPPPPNNMQTWQQNNQPNGYRVPPPLPSNNMQGWPQNVQSQYRAQDPSQLLQQPQTTAHPLASYTLPTLDDFYSPIRWVKFNSKQITSGLAKVTDSDTGTNKQFNINGTIYVPIVDDNVERLGYTSTTETQTKAYVLSTDRIVVKTVLRSVDIKRADDADWLTIEALNNGDKTPLQAPNCQSPGCQSRCQSMGCQSNCMGDTCRSGCVGPSCNAYCNGPGCLSMCIGEKCTAMCDGLSCDARCSGSNCDAKCKKFSCYTTVNGAMKQGGGDWSQWYPQYGAENPGNGNINQGQPDYGGPRDYGGQRGQDEMYAYEKDEFSDPGLQG